MMGIFKLLGAPFSKLPFCSLPGALVGAFSGFIMTLFLLEHPGLALTVQENVLLGWMIGVTSWLIVLLVYGMILQYGVGTIFWPSLANALLTAIVTVFATLWLGYPAIASLTGLLIGILVGALLCRFCREGGRVVHG